MIVNTNPGVVYTDLGEGLIYVNPNTGRIFTRIGVNIVDLQTYVGPTPVVYAVMGVAITEGTHALTFPVNAGTADYAIHTEAWDTYGNPLVVIIPDAGRTAAGCNYISPGDGTMNYKILI